MSAGKAIDRHRRLQADLRTQGFKGAVGEPAGLANISLALFARNGSNRD
jgi:hypothetical protein